MSEKLKNILLVGIFAVLFIPLVKINDLAFPFITGKAFAFRILIEILGAIWFLLAISDKRYRPRFSWFLFAVIAFTGIITAADIFAVNPYRSFWGDFERMDGLLNLLHLVLYFLIVSSIITAKKLWNRFFNTTIAVSVGLSLLGLAQLAGIMRINTDGGRLDSTIGNAAYFGVYLLLHIFLAIFMLMGWQGNQKGRYVYGTIALLHSIILYFTATRSAILGLVGGVFIAATLIIFIERDHKLLRKTAVGAILGILLLIGGFILVKNQPFIRQNSTLNRFAVISSVGVKNQARYYLWIMAIEGFKERPVLGWGQENFKLVFLKNYHPALYNDEITFDRPHNVVLEWLVAGGLLGALGYLSLFIMALYYIWFSKKGDWSIAEKSILTGFLASYFINNLFLFDNITSYIIFFTFLAYIHWQTLTQPEEEKILAKLRKKYEQDKHNKIRQFSVPVVLVVLAIIYFFNAKGIIAAVQYAPAVSFYASEPSVSLSQFKKALGYGSFGYEKIRQDLAIITADIRNRLGIDDKIKQEYFSLAKSEMKKQAEETPPDAHNFYLLGSLLSSYEEYDEALFYLKKARELSPSKQVILLKMGDIYMIKKDYKEAYEMTKYAYELEPSYGLALNAYASAVILMRDNKTASKLLTERYGTDTVFDLRILQAYADTQQYDKIIATYKKRILGKADDIQTRISLSFAYLKSGQQQEAIKTIKEAIEQDPSLKAKGEIWINEIRDGRMPQ